MKKMKRFDSVKNARNSETKTERRVAEWGCVGDSNEPRRQRWLQQQKVGYSTKAAEIFPSLWVSFFAVPCHSTGFRFSL